MRTSLPLIGSKKHAVQHPEELRKKPFLNYEPPALTTELQARFRFRLNHANRLLTNPKLFGCVCPTPILTSTSLIHGQNQLVSICEG